MRAALRRSPRRRLQAGLTLMEVLIAVTLLSALSLAMMFAMRIGLNTFSKAGDKLMANRRVAGAQRVLLEELQGMIPVTAPCSGNAAAAQAPLLTPFFQGTAQTMRFVSSFSLQEAWRGGPRILEFSVIPGGDGGGVRLIVNELPYVSPISAGNRCLGIAADPVTGLSGPVFAPILAGPDSFVLADRLEFCRISFLTPDRTPGTPPSWRAEWRGTAWPLGVRVEMAPIKPDPMQLAPITVTAALRLWRTPGIAYADQ
jgi:prepilin-type N-terminal cleavage/methylation domain-containing protein